MQQRTSGVGARWNWLLAGVAALASAAGCAKPPASANARLAEVKQEAAEMDRALDLLEERLLGAQSNLQLWSEMARRHQSVSALACENAEEHLREMAKNQERKGEKRGLKRRHVASAEPVIGHSSSPPSRRN
ncbi:MAG TPA: hypothetical protein VKE49_01500 [Myxococcaceae bacterium]|nr:hypothetical protein [Myxococcaceae bacterium]